MTENSNGEIMCPMCQRNTLVLRKPKFDGFTRVGDELTCSECGTVFDDDEKLEFVEAAKLDIFTDEDKSAKVDMFEGDEVRFCIHCKYYVVNPFTQRCMLHNKIVQATDSCGQFERQPEDEQPGDEQKP
jgi:hypothetical protein